MTEHKQALQQLNQMGGQWSIKDQQLQTHFKFNSFKDAIDFMANLVAAIDQCDHHPEWTNIYNSVFVKLSTHDVGAITAKDFDLAKQMQLQYQNYETTALVH